MFTRYFAKEYIHDLLNGLFFNIAQQSVYMLVMQMIGVFDVNVLTRTKDRNAGVGGSMPPA